MECNKDVCMMYKNVILFLGYLFQTHTPTAGKLEGLLHRYVWER
jgi:hypothetical protein